MDSESSPSAMAVGESKTKPTASSSSFPTTQIQPPPITVMMQQAIAMQQFQFQQALLMQQVMASQQAAARAATVKSAAEMAAARAAEISKQLKGSDADEENEKTADRSTSRSKSQSSPRSRSRSLSQSRSRSRSRLRSQSRSRSPIRYRRDRSLSGSPIRYRRDHYSPSRYRDNYGYHSRSHSRYRGYYRGGRGDYSWSYYRRDWDRDRGRDYLSHVGRRSRSRSRVRRRSRTRSQSPKYHRDHSLSPRHHREDRSVGRRSKHSRSRERKQSPSRSMSVSRESGSTRKVNKTPLKGGLLPKLKVADDHLGVHGESSDNEHSQSQNSSQHSSRAEMKETVEGIKYDKVPDSPVRSFSVSLNPSFRIEKEQFDEDVNSTRHNRKLIHQHKRDVDIEADKLPLSPEEQAFDRTRLLPKTESSDGLTLGVNGNGHNKGETFLGFLKEYQREPTGCSEKVKRREQTGNLESLDDEMEDGKELDDWRDDIKAYEKEKAMRKESRKEAAKKGADLVVDDAHSNPKGYKGGSFQQYTNTSLDETNDNGKEVDQLAFDGVEVSQDLNSEGIEVVGSLSDVKNGSYNSRYMAEEAGDRDIRHVPYPLLKSMHPVDMIDRNDFEENANVSYNSDGGSRVVNSYESAHEDRESDLIYEGPVVAASEDVCSQQQESPSKHVKKREVMDVEFKQDNFYHHNSTGQYKTASGRDTLEEQSKYFKETADVHVSRKRRGRERSAAKEDMKRVDEEHEKRKDKHKKHRRKHRHETSTEQDDDDDSSNMDGEGRRGKKHHRRKHRKDDTERKERKKRRHKHRVKAVSCSRSQSLSLDGKDKVELGTSTAYRKSLSRQKKRRKETLKLSSPGSGAEI